MKKNCLVAVALLSLALAGGCAKGGNGIVPPPPSIDVSITSPKSVSRNAIYPTQSLTLTATVSHSTTTAVTWSLGPATTCTGTPNPCGTLTPVTPAPTPATAIYVAPATPITGVTVTATLASDSSITGALGLTIVDITTDVAPATLSVGNGLTQTFTAVAVPDYAPQTFAWNCTANGVRCADANFHQDPNVSGLAYYTYTPADSCSGSCIQISAASTIDPNGCSANPKYCTSAKASLVTSRLSVKSTYAFQFSGYDSSQRPVMVAGNFTTDKNGAIVSGFEEEVTSSGLEQYTVTGGSYTPTPSDQNNSNNAGTLALALPAGVYPNQFQVVLDGAGDIEMIESDRNGTGSGIAQKWPSQNQPTFFKGDQTYAFGFTGVDSGGNRVGYVGVLPMNGSSVVGGQMDVNDNGATSTVCGSPCSVAGSYTADVAIVGLWHMTLTAGTTTLHFDFFVASGTTGKTNPLTFYAISTDTVDSTHPAISGTMVLQDSSLTYNNAALKGTSVSALTGVNGANTNVSLTLGTTDGNGNFSGQFDQNNAGTILSGVQFPSASSAYTYTAAGSNPSNNGRYTFNMLGNPGASPVVQPLPFVFYASGANRGFLLDQNSSSVMTGTMNPQGKIPCAGGLCALSASELPGTFAAATTSSGSSGVDAIAANLLLTWVNTGACTSECVNGTLYDAANPTGVILTGANPGYTLMAAGNGTISLTTPSKENYAIYVVDTSGCTNASGPVCAIQDFLMIDEDKTNTNPSIIFAQQ